MRELVSVLLWTVASMFVVFAVISLIGSSIVSAPTPADRERVQVTVLRAIGYLLAAIAITVVYKP